MTKYRIHRLSTEEVIVEADGDTRMKNCFECGEGASTIILEQHPDSLLFRMNYGRQVRDNLTYAEAATELGGCIMHLQACADLLDSSGP